MACRMWKYSGITSTEAGIFVWYLLKSLPLWQTADFQSCSSYTVDSYSGKITLLRVIQKRYKFRRAFQLQRQLCTELDCLAMLELNLVFFFFFYKHHDCTFPSEICRELFIISVDSPLPTRTEANSSRTCSTDHHVTL